MGCSHHRHLPAGTFYLYHLHLNAQSIQASPFNGDTLLLWHVLGAEPKEHNVKHLCVSIYLSSFVHIKRQQISFLSTIHWETYGMQIAFLVLYFECYWFYVLVWETGWILLITDSFDLEQIAKTRHLREVNKSGALREHMIILTMDYAAV